MSNSKSGFQGKSVNQLYNKTILYKPTLYHENESFDLCFLTYNGKLTKIVDYFNKKNRTIEENIKEVQDAKDPENLNRTPLQISAFLNFSNIFLYLLTYEADHLYADDNGQNTWHNIAYRGHIKIFTLLLNHIRYKLKLESLIKVDAIKKSSGFSKLDINKGKLSRAVHLTELNINKFNNLQKEMRDESTRLLKKFIEILQKALTQKDIEGQTPLHLAAMSKFPLSHQIIYYILDYDFFKLDETWDDYLSLFESLQMLEVKADRTKDSDPRRSLRLEREFLNLLGEGIIANELTPKFQELKKNLIRELININDKHGDTILHISSFHGDYRIVNKLVTYGGDKKARNSEEKMPVELAKDNFVRKVLTNLNKAAKSSDENNIKELVNFGQDINEKISIFSQAPIHKIIESKEEKKHEVLEKMLDLGADPNIKDSNGWSALHYACQLGDLESVKILLRNKADINTYSNNKRIPLHLAANMNYPKIVEYLLNEKADPNYKDNEGCTPLHLAAKQGNTKCIEHLLDNKAELYSLDFRGWTILHYAAFHGHKKTVRFICKYDADYDKLRNTRNSQNKLPIEIVRDPSVKPYFISLWHAAKDGDLDMTRNLLNAGENIDDMSNFEKNTPLHLATINNHYLLVRLLIELGARTDMRNSDGKFAWEYAKEMKKDIQHRFKMSEDKIRDVFDLRETVRENDNLLGKRKDIIDATICKANWKLRVWTANDFNEKIRKILKVEENDGEEGYVNVGNEINKEGNEDKKGN